MNVDPLTAQSNSYTATIIPPGDLLPFLTDLAAGFDAETLAGVITPTLSLFFQEWFAITPTPDLLGTEWRRYLGAVSVLVQVKAIAALVCYLPFLAYASFQP